MLEEAEVGPAPLPLEECTAREREQDVAGAEKPRRAAGDVVTAVEVRRLELGHHTDPSVGQLENVFLYNLDDLQAVVSANLERRRAELPTAEDLIAGEVGKYWDWVAGLAAVPVLAEMRAHMEAVRMRELAETLRRLQHLPAAERAAVEELSRKLMNKFLHEPSVRLRAAAANGRGLGVVDTARYLFGLERSEDVADTAPDLQSRARE